MDNKSISLHDKFVKSAQQHSIMQDLEKWYEKRGKKKAIGQKMIAAGYDKRGWNIIKCGNQMAVEYCTNCGKHHIRSTNLCRDKLCPVCRWRLSLRRYAEMVQVCDVLAEDYPRARYMFLTLTIKNCPMDKLHETLQQMSKAWNRMLQRKFFKIAVSGWARSVEVTYNKNTREAHPHYHVILQLLPTETAAEREGIRMIGQYWQKALNVSYAPIYDIRDIKADEMNTDISAAVCETFKYCVKDKSMEDMTLEVFTHFVAAVTGIRTTSFGGTIKKTRMFLGFTDKSAEVVQNEEPNATCTNCGAALQTAIFEWAGFDGIPHDKGLEKLLKLEAAK